jgi:TDG/mug DNA glycosylase family protein
VTARETARRRPPAAARTLPDHLRPGLRVLFCGINPGLRSAEVGHHFAGPTNRFWALLHESGLVPQRLGPEQDARLLEWGYGITNLVARATPGVSDLRPHEYRAGREVLVDKVARLRPAVLALVGVTVYRAVVPEATRRAVHLGLQDDVVHGARVFVLPNPSGRNAHFTRADMLAAFQGLAGVVGVGGVAPSTRSAS